MSDCSAAASTVAATVEAAIPNPTNAVPAAIAAIPTPAPTTVKDANVPNAISAPPRPFANPAIGSTRAVNALAVTLAPLSPEYIDLVMEVNPAVTPETTALNP